MVCVHIYSESDNALLRYMAVWSFPRWPSWIWSNRKWRRSIRRLGKLQMATSQQCIILYVCTQTILCPRSL